MVTKTTVIHEIKRVVTAIGVAGGMTIAIIGSPVAANTPTNNSNTAAQATIAYITQGVVADNQNELNVSISPTSVEGGGVSPASSCTRRADIIAKNGVWRHVKYVSSRRVLNFWTNTAGHSQTSHKVKLGKGVDIDVLGGGSLWTCPDQDSWNSAYSHNPLGGVSVAWLKSHGLARNHQ